MSKREGTSTTERDKSSGKRERLRHVNKRETETSQREKEIENLLKSEVFVFTQLHTRYRTEKSQRERDRDM